MPSILFSEVAYTAADSESVLECLERNGVSIPNACRSGVCHSCMMRVTDGEVPAAAQKGLSEAKQIQGYFLSCCCVPETDLAVATVDDAMPRVPAWLEGTETLNNRVIRVRLRTESALNYRPGQFVNFLREDGLVRSFSLASVPGLDDALDFHVALVPGGRMSGWLHHDAGPGSRLELAGPLGNCFYIPGKPEQPILLLGTGTGLAPLYGILRDALHQGHTGPIHLFHGALRLDDLYLTDALRALAAEHGNFHYHPCVRDEAGPEWVTTGAVDATALGMLPSLKGWKVFLCGNPDLVRQVQRKTFLAGASMQDIHADAFLPAKQ